MKKFTAYFLVVVSAVLAACSIPQIKRDDVSFEGLKTFYVESPRNGGEVFAKYNNRAEIDATLVQAIAANLEAKGFVRSFDRGAAEIVFVPVWSVSLRGGENAQETHSGVPRIGNAAQNATQTRVEYYATLEIQAFLRGDGKWGWRGFSPVETETDNITTFMLKNQARWALEYFPPERYPEPKLSLLSFFGLSKVDTSERAESGESAEASVAASNGAGAKSEAKSGAAEVKSAGVSAKASVKKSETIADINKAFEKSLEKKADSK